MHFGVYLKTAFLNRWNQMLFWGGVAFGIVSIAAGAGDNDDRAAENVLDLAGDDAGDAFVGLAGVDDDERVGFMPRPRDFHAFAVILFLDPFSFGRLQGK